MARLPRLVLPGAVHLVQQRAHGARPIFTDETDRLAYRQVLREATLAEQAAVHAYALGDAEVRLLLTVSSADALSRLMQAVGRGYVSAYNRRHGCQGTLWAGRFGCAVVEPGAWTLDALLAVDASSGPTSATHRAGGVGDTLLTDPPEYWQLGNTPFEREAAWRQRLDAGVAPSTLAAMQRALRGGWALGSAAFLQRLAEASPRPVQPRPRGRPRKTARVAGAARPARTAPP